MAEYIKVKTYSNLTHIAGEGNNTISYPIHKTYTHSHLSWSMNTMLVNFDAALLPPLSVFFKYQNNKNNNKNILSVPPVVLIISIKLLIRGENVPFSALYKRFVLFKTLGGNFKRPIRSPLIRGPSYLVEWVMG